MPRMIEDTTQPPDQPMQAKEKAFNIVWCDEAHDGIDFSDVVEKAQGYEDCRERAFDILSGLSGICSLNQNSVLRLRSEVNEMFEEIAVKMLEGDL